MRFRVIRKLLTKHKKPEETEDMMASGSNSASGSGVLTESVRTESTSCSKLPMLGLKWIILTIQFKQQVG